MGNPFSIVFFDYLNRSCVKGTIKDFCSFSGLSYFTVVRLSKDSSFSLVYNVFLQLEFYILHLLNYSYDPDGVHFLMVEDFYLLFLTDDFTSSGKR